MNAFRNIITISNELRNGRKKRKKKKKKNNEISGVMNERITKEHDENINIRGIYLEQR